MNVRLARIAALLVTLVFGLARALEADQLSIYTFEGGGNLIYSGGASPIAQEDGSGLPMGVNGLFLMNGQPAVSLAACGSVTSNCGVELQTGNLIGTDATHWFFDGGGSISLTGGVNAGGGLPPTGPELIPAGTLFTGTFLSAYAENTNYPLYI